MAKTAQIEIISEEPGNRTGTDSAEKPSSMSVDESRKNGCPKATAPDRLLENMRKFRMKTVLVLFASLLSLLSGESFAFGPNGSPFPIAVIGGSYYTRTDGSYYSVLPNGGVRREQSRYEIRHAGGNFFVGADSRIYLVKSDGAVLRTENTAVNVTVAGGNFYQTADRKLYIVQSNGGVRQSSDSVGKIIIAGGNYFVTAGHTFYFINNDGSLFASRWTPEIQIAGGNYFVTKQGEFYSVKTDAGGGRMDRNLRQRADIAVAGGSFFFGPDGVLSRVNDDGYIFRTENRVPVLPASTCGDLVSGVRAEPLPQVPQ